jgi:hypothetical protein
LFLFTHGILNDFLPTARVSLQRQNMSIECCMFYGRWHSRATLSVSQEVLWNNTNSGIRISGPRIDPGISRVQRQNTSNVTATFSEIKIVFALMKPWVCLECWGVDNSYIHTHLRIRYYLHSLKNLRYHSKVITQVKLKCWPSAVGLHGYACFNLAEDSSIQSSYHMFWVWYEIRQVILHKRLTMLSK